MGSENYYSVLGIRQDATDEQVKQAFRDRAKTCHPDRHPNNKEAELEFKRINTAYEGLKDAARRDAYNEWLSFAQKRQRSRLMQWSRLAALTAVLLLGPSALLYWAIAIADLPGVYLSSRSISPEEAERAARMAAVKEATEDEILPAAAEAEAARPAEDEDKLSQADEKPNEISPEIADLYAEPAPLPQSVPDQSADPSSRDLSTQAAPEETGQPGQNPPANTVATLTVPQQSSAERTGAPTEFIPDGRQFSSPTEEVTQSITRRPLSETPSSTAGQPQSILPRPAGDLSPDANGRVGDAVSQDGGSTSGSQQATDEAAAEESRARAMARLIAELKEPDATPESEGTFADAPLNAGRDQPQNRFAEQFTDCRDCPVMALVSEIEAVPDRPPLAISRKQVTILEWNVCVEEGVCPSYGPISNADGSRPILNVAKRDAELYVEWLSRKTGQNYQLIAPLKVDTGDRSAAASRQQDCLTAARRRNSSWEWLDDAPRREPDCDAEPQESGRAERGNELHGFRVARRVVAER